MGTSSASRRRATPREHRAAKCRENMTETTATGFETRFMSSSPILVEARPSSPCAHADRRPWPGLRPASRPRPSSPRGAHAERWPWPGLRRLSRPRRGIAGALTPTVGLGLAWPGLGRACGGRSATARSTRSRRRSPRCARRRPRSRRRACSAAGSTPGEASAPGVRPRRTQRAAGWPPFVHGAPARARNGRRWVTLGGHDS